MIELTNPLLYSGRIVPAGAKLVLPHELAEKMIAAGNAIPCEPSLDTKESASDPPAEPPESPPEEPPAAPPPEAALGRQWGGAQ